MCLKRLHVLFLLATVLLFSPLAVMAQVPSEIYVASSVNVNVDELDSDQLAAVFLGQQRRWPDGTRVKLALLKSSLSQSQFFPAIVDRSPGQYWAHWRNIVFSGRGIMPRVFKTETELIAYLQNQKGAIGQINNKEMAVRQGLAVLNVKRK